MVWKEQWVQGDRLCTSGGKRLQVVFPGLENWEEGPDFRKAILSIENNLLKGDVELHLKASHWRAHAHHLDPNYNGVVLHVVLWDNDDRKTTLQNGSAVPILPLNSYLDASLEEICLRSASDKAPEPVCGEAVGRLGREQVERILDEAGEKRFYEKAGRFEADISCKEPEEVLYSGLMEALGYERNKKPFLELARRMPIRVVEGFSMGKPQEKQVQIIQALLFGTAGLLPFQRQGIVQQRDEWTGDLESTWQNIYPGDAMGKESWRFFRVRPENLPTRRIGAASYLVQRYLRTGLVEGLLRQFLELMSKGEVGKLTSPLVLPAKGYWTSHTDFGCNGARGSALLGKGRAGEMVVNVLLPFFFAFGEAYRLPEVRRSALEAYIRHPRLEENHITREMRLRLHTPNDSNIVKSALRQQGLIQLFKTHCQELRCSVCPLIATP